MANIRLSFQTEEFRKHLQKISKNLSGRKKKAILRKAARIVKNQLRQDAPSDSGTLKKTAKELTWSKSPDYFASFSRKPAIYNPKKKKATEPYFAAFLNEGWTHTFFPKPKGAVKRGTKGAIVMEITKHKNFIANATRKASPEAIAKIEKEVIKAIQNP